MTFLVSKMDADRAVQMLHDVFVTLEDHEYDRLKKQFHEAVTALLSSKTNNNYYSPPVT
jgi:hypothetical protein